MSSNVAIDMLNGTISIEKIRAVTRAVDNETRRLRALYRTNSWAALQPGFDPPNNGPKKPLERLLAAFSGAGLLYAPPFLAFVHHRQTVDDKVFPFDRRGPYE